MIKLSAAAIAAMGRDGDSVLAHVTVGDVVVPVERIDVHVSEELNKLLGDNIGRYTVGNNDNVINPQTGLAEFTARGMKFNLTRVSHIWPIIAAIGWMAFAGIWWFSALNAEINALRKEMADVRQNISRLDTSDRSNILALQRAVDERNGLLREEDSKTAQNIGQVQAQSEAIRHIERRLELLEHPHK